MKLSTLIVMGGGGIILLGMTILTSSMNNAYDYPVGNKKINVKFGLMGDKLSYRRSDSSNVIMTIKREDRDYIVTSMGVYDAKDSLLAQYFPPNIITDQAQDSVNKWIHYIELDKARKMKGLQNKLENRELELGKKALE